MSGSVDRTRQLVESGRAGRFGQKASLQAAGVELPQHNANVKKSKPKKAAAKKTATKKSAAKTPAKKAVKKS